ncbi:MAG TPA: L-2-hydroxyglutarate oxidase [Candidatus Polarisedimenticolia bacterium]|nr:L-2-hydroxyglutarate oxidase [Candidatus Polarisedimenticolia bacterium]
MVAPRFDVVIVGAGLVGLATAMETARRYPRLRTLVLEKEQDVAAHQTGRNSGVIHSGLYYKPGSLKARLCRDGAESMLAFCRSEGIPHQVCGKVVVATHEREIPGLLELHRRGTASGVPGLELIGPERLRELEPHAAGLKALHVPGAAITDYAAVARRCRDILAGLDVEVRTGTRVTGLERNGTQTMVETTRGDIAARHLVNCGGLHSDRIARMAGERPGLIIVPFRGEYYEIDPSRRSLVRGLIYPVPDPAFPFLGVHLTPRIQGGVEAGPNAVLALKREGYRRRDVSVIDTAGALSFPGFWKMARRHARMGLAELWRSLSKKAFLRELQRLVPDLREEDLLPGGSGVRAQALERTGALVDDFRFLRREGATHVLNAPSPAATASFAIARVIVDELAADLPAPVTAS